MSPERDSVDAQLDALLADWYEHCQGYQMTRSFTGAASAQEYRAPIYMDWKNGAEDERAKELVVSQVDAAIQRLPNPEGRRYRTAIEFYARNLVRRITVWYSPYLPPTRAERDVLILEARNMLLLELRKDGVIG